MRRVRCGGLPRPADKAGGRRRRGGVSESDALEPLAQACAEEQRYEFMFMALPLKIARGTGSPVNPIALF